MNHDPRLLFLRVAEELDLKRAALRCGVTQRLIRHSISRLETEYGSPLCIIQTKKVVLTEAGERLHRSFCTVGVDDDVVRTVTVMEDTMSEHGVTEWMSGAACQVWPLLRIERLKGNSKLQVEGLDSGTVDSVMLYGWPAVVHPDLTFVQLYAHELAAFILKNPRTGTSPLSYASLRRRRWILPAEVIMPGLANLLAWECRKDGFLPSMLATRTKSHFLDAIRSDNAVGYAPSNFLSSLPIEIVRVPIVQRTMLPFGCLHRTHEASTSVHRFLNLMCRLTTTQNTDEGQPQIKFLLSERSLPRASGEEQRCVHTNH